jgi:hypothetical protein
MGPDQADEVEGRLLSVHAQGTRGPHQHKSHSLRAVGWVHHQSSGVAPQFLEFSYIGAVWPQFDDGQNAGNGGFLPRSKRLLALSRDVPYDRSTPEDFVIVREARESLESKRVGFAPSTLAQHSIGAFSFATTAAMRASAVE